MPPNNSPKPFTFLSRTAPYGSARPAHCLDMALAAAVFEQPVRYVFLGEGIYQLLKEQQGETIGSKTLGKTLGALELYGIEKVYVCQVSLQQRQLSSEDLLIPVTPASPKDLQKLISNSACVFNF